ncbi:AGE family epimerase/isomerase [Georgenia faecalis]|uniref:AGE family epimerase/isomerase n=1 Tax=Georgenia faecalis TaxID=2483799 RepID=UPI000FD7481A|nr:AGE family epimerase/isomerase [Georgenia faecalis]
MTAPRSWRAHLEQHVLPWWERAADDERGGVLTCFDNAGRLLSEEKYTWSQGRWAWLCAELADEAEAGRLDLDAAMWRRRAGETARFLADHALTPDHRTAFRLDRTGHQLVSGADGEVSTSVFADLFAVLGLAGALRTPGAPTHWQTSAMALLDVAERSIADRTARSEPYPVPSGFRDLAGPMSLLHTAAELERARPGCGAGAVRDRAADALTEQFFGAGTWWEFAPEAPADATTLLARHRTPGHLLECLWMLVHAGADVPLERLEALALRALAIGWDDAEGGILRYADADGGRPCGTSFGDVPYEALVRSTWDTKLWWVHAEALYATSLLAARCASAELARWHERVAGYTMATFPDPAGEWLQIRDRAGRPLDAVVALPVKDPFHIIRSLIFLNREAQNEGPESD